MAKSKPTARPTPKVTSPKAATSASNVLKSNSTSKTSKSVAGSALSQTNASKKTTTPNVAAKASNVLRDGRTSKNSKSSAGSALSQTKSNKK